jgi:hypothetical protein
VGVAISSPFVIARLPEGKPTDLSLRGLPQGARGNLVFKNIEIASLSLAMTKIASFLAMTKSKSLQ